MKNWLKDIRNPIIAGLVIAVVILLLITQCKRQEQPVKINYDTITLSDTIKGDSIKYEVHIPAPYPVYKDTGRIVYIPDTAKFIGECLTENFYEWTLKDDTGAFAQLKFSVFLNMAQQGDFVFQNRRPTVINTTITPTVTPKERNFKLFVGGGIGGSATSFNVNAGILMQYKSVLTGVNYGFMDKSINIPIYYKVSLGKRKK